MKTQSQTAAGCNNTMANQNAVSRWLEETQKKYPDLLQCGKEAQLRELVNKYRSFQTLLEAGELPVCDGSDYMREYDDERIIVDELDEMPASASIVTDSLDGFLHAVTRIGCCVTLKAWLGNKSK